MFLPKEMTAVQLIVPEQDLPAVTGDLADRGILHPIDAAETDWKNVLGDSASGRADAAGDASLERDILSVMQSLQVPEGRPPADESLAPVEGAAVRPVLERIAREIRETNVRLEAERKRLERLTGYLRPLETIADVSFDLRRMRDARYIHSLLGVMPAVNVARLETSLERTPHVLVTLREDRRNAVVWLSGLRADADLLERASRSAYLNPLDIPAVHGGTPAEIIASVRTAVRRVRERISALQAELESVRRKREAELRSLLWRTRISRNRAEAVAHYGRLRYSALIAGWVPSEKWGELAARPGDAYGRSLADAAPRDRGAGSEDVPVLVEHGGLLRSFQQLAEVFARPRYNELDPTVLLAATFPLLYGLMFGDVGHGLELALLGALLAGGRIAPLRGFAGLGPLIAVCGLSGCLFGFLYGSVFGLETVLPPLWVRPMDGIFTILGASIAAGIALLSAGFLLRMINAAIAGEWGRLLFDRSGLAGLVLYWSLAGLAAGAFGLRLPVPAAAWVAAAVAAGCTVMFSEVLVRLLRGRRPLLEENPASFTVQAFFELFETVIGLFSNSMSYIRLGAFAVAHAGLSLVFFLLAGQVSPGGGIGYWIVVLIGNFLIVGFEGLIVGIQSMRLEYYEFYNKFFRGGGVRFRPLTRLPDPR
jgi:V/A-type H+-transporting ATPase subunit I